MDSLNLFVLGAMLLYRGESTTTTALAAMMIMGAQRPPVGGSHHHSAGAGRHSHGGTGGNLTLGELLSAVRPAREFPLFPIQVPLYLKLPLAGIK